MKKNVFKRKKKIAINKIIKDMKLEIKALQELKYLPLIEIALSATIIARNVSEINIIRSQQPTIKGTLCLINQQL